MGCERGRSLSHGAEKEMFEVDRVVVALKMCYYVYIMFTARFIDGGVIL